MTRPHYQFPAAAAVLCAISWHRCARLLQSFHSTAFLSSEGRVHIAQLNKYTYVAFYTVSPADIVYQGVQHAHNAAEFGRSLNEQETCKISPDNAHEDAAPQSSPRTHAQPTLACFGRVCKCVRQNKLPFYQGKQATYMCAS